MSQEIQYQVEDAPKAGLLFQRWARVTGISLIAAVALVGSFGAGVYAGQHMQGGTSLSQQGQFDGGQFGGQNGPGFGPGKGGPGGCPANDPDHCAGTDRNTHDFQLPSASPSVKP
ncbi:MAG: hypothetical protein ACKOWK_02545 [Micrococcales bacterium]